MPEMKTASAYIRVSTDEQAELSPDSQLAVIRAYAEKNGLVIPEQYILVDEGISGRSAGRVYRLMKGMKLPKMSTVKPPKAAVSKEDAGVCQNLLSQKFDQKAPNMVWVSDFTYVRVGGKFYYICVILDLYARKVIACRASDRIDRFLAIDTLRDAVRLRGVSEGVMFHSDRGSQFTSQDFRKVIDELGMVQSFSAKGHPYDNAVMECFFKYLKKEELDRRSYQSVGQLKQSLLAYISGFYNPLRPHSHNHGLSPNQAEDQFPGNFACPLY
ncbi:MAG: IS3 family transposase [Butyricicoccus sp.]|nr:IS3 family transposase [Butyricicoccus sp.]